MKNTSSLLLSPALVTLLVATILVAVALLLAGGDPLVLARLGTRFSQADPQGSEGYDGQFVYYIARNPDPQAVAAYLDVPAYRYQRILLPLLARTLALGRVELIPWLIIMIGVVSLVGGTWVVSELLAGWGVSRWYALVYGLWVGFVLAVRLDLPEPLAYALVAGALLASEHGRPRLSWLLYGLALFAKEVTVAFVLAALLSSLVQRRWQDVGGLLLVAIAPYALFQGWLWWIFGQPGIGSGGNMATPFELIPFMGLWRIANYSLAYLGAMLLVFGPATLLPTIWGIWASLKKLLEHQTNVVVLALLINALLIASLPFSTFRETGGLLRFMCGLVLAVLLFAARYKIRRVLNYSGLWLVLNAFVLKSGGF
jgi:hypothetical protein